MQLAFRPSKLGDGGARTEPLLCVKRCSEHKCPLEVLFREHLKHPKHPEQLIGAGHDGTIAELNPASNPADLARDLLKILLSGDRSLLAQVKQDIHQFGAIGILLQSAKMIDYLFDGHRSAAFCVNDSIPFVYRISDGHILR